MGIFSVHFFFEKKGNLRNGEERVYGENEDGKNGVDQPEQREDQLDDLRKVVRRHSCFLCRFSLFF